jgi:pantothenate kinase
MTCENSHTSQAITNLIKKTMPSASTSHIKELLASIKSEHEINLGRVHSTFNHFVYHYEVGSHSLEHTVQDLGRMMNLRFRDNAPRRPPRVIILGPPGSGRSTTAEIISKRYGLVNVSPLQLVQAEAKINPMIKTKVQQALDSGHEIPDDILKRVIDQRLG